MKENENIQVGPNVPSSWNYGSFHLHSRLYTSFLQRDLDMTQQPPQPVPITTTSLYFNSDAPAVLPPHATPKIDVKGDLISKKGNQAEFIGSNWQRTSKSMEGPKNKVASEEYFRALKAYREASSNAKRLELMNSKAMSILLAGKHIVILNEQCNTFN